MGYSLGIICHGWHDAAAVLVRNGTVIAAAEEERFSRKKYDASFPLEAIQYCLAEGGIGIQDLSAIGYGFDVTRKPVEKALHLVKYFPSSMGLFLGRQDLFKKMSMITGEIREKLGYTGPVHRLNHHLCHAVSAFYASPFQQAAILTLDGAGDWESSWWGTGDGTKIQELGAISWPHSLGHIYAAFTEYLGFQKFADEYKVMGLAAYGEPLYVKEMNEIFWPNGLRYGVDLSYFQFQKGNQPYFSRKLVDTFGPALKSKVRTSDGEISEKYRNIAASLQMQLERVVFSMVEQLVEQTGLRRLCLSGGVAMNCVMNGRILEMGLVDELYLPPCAGDAGVALGAAYLAEKKQGGNLDRQVLETALLGPAYKSDRVRKAIEARGLKAVKLDDPSKKAAEMISQGKVIGWFQGRMEFGQRALGARSILADPRRAEMKDLINVKVKFREIFRPFAPSVIEERAKEYFQYFGPSPFMTQVYPVREEKKAVIPAVTHADGSGRIQTVSKSVNPRYWQLIHHFGELTKIPVVLNTSFNVKGQPIVNTPEEAVDTFLRTDIDALICEGYLVTKTP